MNKIFLFIVLNIITFLAHAEVQVQIEPSTVIANEAFQLTITQSGAQSGGVPDLSVLKNDFLILGTARQVSYSLINGQSSMSHQWIVNLKPLKSGVISIPSINIGSEHTSPMTINVDTSTAATTSSDLDDQALVLKTSVDQEHPFVNQEIIYTVKLFNSKQLIDANYEPPQVKDALIIPLGDAKRYKSNQNNTQYIVEEQRYAVFPQKSGTLKIISPSFTALVYDFKPQKIKAQDKERVIQVKPIPATYPGDLWLPAKKVILKEQYENAQQQLSQGSTLVRTITLEGEGIPAQLLPNLTFKNATEFNVYPEKGTDKNQVRQGELRGSTEFKVTYLFNKPGKVVLPEVRVNWYNTQSGKEEVASLAPRSIEITPAPNSSTNNSKTSSSLNSSPPFENRSKQDHSFAKTPSSEGQTLWPWYLSLFFAGAWLITLSLWLWQKTTKVSTKGQYKKALLQLKHACMESNPQAARDALLHWASLHWPDARILNLNDLLSLTHAPKLKKQIQILSESLYQKASNSVWQGNELLAAVHAMKKKVRKDTQKSYKLPPINPV